jgi:hypothetical protein
MSKAGRNKPCPCRSRKINELPRSRRLNCRGACAKRPLKGFGVRRGERRYNFGLKLLDVVRRNLELVAVGIAEINRVRDFVILEFDFDSALFQFLLRSPKILAVRAESEMKHSNFAMCGCFRLLVRGEQGDSGVSFANESRHSIPHAIVKPLEPEDLDVPLSRSFNVAHTHSYMVNTFEFHAILDRIYLSFHQIGNAILGRARPPGAPLIACG